MDMFAGSDILAVGASIPLICPRGLKPSWTLKSVAKDFTGEHKVSHCDVYASVCFGVQQVSGILNFAESVDALHCLA